MTAPQGGKYEGIRILETAAVCAASNCGDQSRTAAAFSAGASLAPLRESKTQFSNNFFVEDDKIVSNMHRDYSLVATENLFALIIQSYVFEQSMIYLKIISFNIADY